MAKTSVAEKVNGVNIEQLKQVIARMNDAAQARFTFQAENHWHNGSHNQSSLSEYAAGGQRVTREEPFVLTCDEPVQLAGQDEAPNPVEYLLHALAGCLTTSLAMHAAARGIEIRSISSRVEGDVDVRGFLGIDPNVPKGYQRIRATLRVGSDAPADRLAELARFSPVYNMLSKSVPLDLAIEKQND